MARTKTAKSDLPALVVDDATLDELEASWPKTKELAFAIDDPLEKLQEKAHNIFAGKYWENLDALAIRIADVCPKGVTEENFLSAQPVAKACRSYFANVEKLRTGLNRPFLDAKKAVDEAAKATVARAEGTLLPIIEAVKKIEDRKKEEAAKAAADRLKKIEDDRLKAEQEHRDKIEAEHAAEKKRLADEAKRLADEAAASRKMVEESEARNKAANEELAQLRKQIEAMGRADTRTEVKGTPEIAEVLAKAPLGKVIPVAPAAPGFPEPTIIDTLEKTIAAMPEFEDEPPVVTALRETLGATMVNVGKQPEWEPAALPPLFDDEPTPEPFKQPQTFAFTQEQLDANSRQAETSAELAKDGVTVDPSFDQQKVRDFGTALMQFQFAIKRPLLVKQDARQAVELAMFDICEIANRLQEWTP